MTVPPIGPKDLLIVTPTGGDPKSSTRFLEVARANGAVVAAFTANRAGKVGELADVFVEAEARTMEKSGGETSIQPMCTTLEQTGLLVFDTVTALLDRHCELLLPQVKSLIAGELERGILNIRDEELDRLSVALGNSGRIFVQAEGRELLLLSCFAMRLFHMGFSVHAAGEVTAPKIGPQDSMLLFCSGDYEFSLLNALQAKRAGAKVLILAPEQNDAGLCGVFGESFAPFAADLGSSAQPAGLALGQQLLIGLDDAVLNMMRKTGLHEADLSARHTNLE
jgi:6-phospho-3-hexuloisomerase